MRRFLPRIGGLVLVAALVGAVVWLRPEPPRPESSAPPPPAPPQGVVLTYADGSKLWSSADGGQQTDLVRRVLADLADEGLSFDQLRSSRAVVTTTIDAKAQTMAAAVVGRLVAPHQLGAAVTAIDPVSGDVRVYLGVNRGADLAGEPKELTPEIVRPFTDAGVPDLVRAQMSPLDVTAAYVAFAGAGKPEPDFVTSVTGADGLPLLQKVRIIHVVLDRQVADRITAQLKQKPACNGVACVPDAGQWTVGYTLNLAVTVFVDSASADLSRVVWQEFLASQAG